MCRDVIGYKEVSGYRKVTETSAVSVCRDVIGYKEVSGYRKVTERSTCAEMSAGTERSANNSPQDTTHSFLRPCFPF